VSLPSPKRMAVLLACSVAVIVGAKTLAIELQYQYNARHIVTPARVHPPARRQIVPVRVLRVSREKAAGEQV